MRNLLVRNLRGGVTGSLIGLFLVSLVFAFSVRVGQELPFTQHYLSTITDHYYLVYVVIPLFLLVCFFVIDDDTDVVVMRFGTYFSYFLSKWRSMVVISAVFMLVQLLAIGISGIGLGMSDEWLLDERAVTHELFTFLSGLFPSPSLASGAATMYMFVGLSIISMMTMWVGHFFSKSAAVRVLVVAYVLSIMSMRIPSIGTIPVTLFNHLVILHHNLTPFRGAVTAGTTVVLVGFMMWSVKTGWNRRFMRSPGHIGGITAYYCRQLINARNMMIMTCVVVVMVVWKYFQGGGTLHGEDWILSLYAGHGTGSFHAMGLIEMLLMTSTPLYLLAGFIDKATTADSTYMTVRVRSRMEILNGILASAVAFVLVYGLILAFVPLIAMTLTGFPPDVGALSLLVFSVTLRLWDILAQLFVMIVLYCLTRQMVLSFLSLVAINLIPLVPLHAMGYLPFGLSSLARINLPSTGQGIASPAAIGILLGTAVAAMWWLLTRGYRRLPRN